MSFWESLDCHIERSWHCLLACFLWANQMRGPPKETAERGSTYTHQSTSVHSLEALGYPSERRGTIALGTAMFALLAEGKRHPRFAERGLLLANLSCE